MAMPFSSPDEAIINSVVPLSELTLASTSKAQGIDVDTLYDLPRVARLIHQHGFQRVALQFPDELLGDSTKVFWSLERHVKAIRATSASSAGAPAELYVLADTSYGNCCVDEVAAEHVEADVVVHFGHACLSLTARLPAIYVFHRLPIDVDHCVTALVQRIQDERSEQGEHKTDRKMVMMYDVGYEHASEDVCTKLRKATARDIDLSKMDKEVNFDRYVRPPPVTTAEDEASTASTVQDNVAEYVQTSKNQIQGDTVDQDNSPLYLYIGPESLALTNLLLRLGPSAKVLRYDASTQQATEETGRTNRLLQRRYAAVQKARDARTVGLLVGTLGLQSYLPLLQHLRHHLQTVQRKRVYTISVGKLNPAKLANFQEIDVFVLVACPENSLVDAAAGLKGAHDARDFFRPIVTPFELLTAFKGREWTGEYVLDLEEVYGQARQVEQGRSTGEGKQGEEEDDDDNDTPHFSLVTGGLVSSTRRLDLDRENNSDPTEDNRALQYLAGQTDTNEGIVTVRNADGTLTRVMESAGAAHLASRSWRGLERRLGIDEPAPLEVGRTGIAKGYTAGQQDQQEGGG